MISDANDGYAAGQQHWLETAEDSLARARLTFFCMASLLACAFSATSAIEIGSSTHPYTYEKAGRESFGPITRPPDLKPTQVVAIAHGECLRVTCQSVAGPIVRIAAPPHVAPHSGPQDGPPLNTTESASVVAARDARQMRDTADDDDAPPPLPDEGHAQSMSATNIAPLPVLTRGSRLPHYIEVALPASTPWFALPSVALDAPSIGATDTHTTVALARGFDSMQR